MIQAMATAVTAVAAAVETTGGQPLAEMEVNQVILLEGQVIGVILFLNKKIFSLEEPIFVYEKNMLFLNKNTIVFV